MGVLDQGSHTSRERGSHGLGGGPRFPLCGWEGGWTGQRRTADLAQFPPPPPPPTPPPPPPSNCGPQETERIGGSAKGHLLGLPPSPCTGHLPGHSHASSLGGPKHKHMAPPSPTAGQDPKGRYSEVAPRHCPGVTLYWAALGAAGPALCQGSKWVEALE